MANYMHSKSRDEANTSSFTTTLVPAQVVGTLSLFGMKASDVTVVTTAMRVYKEMSQVTAPEALQGIMLLLTTSFSDFSKKVRARNYKIMAVFIVLLREMDEKADIQQYIDKTADISRILADHHIQELRIKFASTGLESIKDLQRILGEFSRIKQRLDVRYSTLGKALLEHSMYTLKDIISYRNWFVDQNFLSKCPEQRRFLPVLNREFSTIMLMMEICNVIVTRNNRQVDHKHIMNSFPVIYRDPAQDLIEDTFNKMVDVIQNIYGECDPFTKIYELAKQTWLELGDNKEDIIQIDNVKKVLSNIWDVIAILRDAMLVKKETSNELFSLLYGTIATDTYKLACAMSSRFFKDIIDPSRIMNATREARNKFYESNLKQKIRKMKLKLHPDKRSEDMTEEEANKQFSEFHEHVAVIIKFLSKPAQRDDQKDDAYESISMCSLLEATVRSFARWDNDIQDLVYMHNDALDLLDRIVMALEYTKKHYMEYMDDETHARLEELDRQSYELSKIIEDKVHDEEFPTLGEANRTHEKEQEQYVIDISKYGESKQSTMSHKQKVEWALYLNTDSLAFKVEYGIIHPSIIKMCNKIQSLIYSYDMPLIGSPYKQDCLLAHLLYLVLSRGTCGVWPINAELIVEGIDQLEACDPKSKHIQEIITNIIKSLEISCEPMLTLINLLPPNERAMVQLDRIKNEQTAIYKSADKLFFGYIEKKKKEDKKDEEDENLILTVLDDVLSMSTSFIDIETKCKSTFCIFRGRYMTAQNSRNEGTGWFQKVKQRATMFSEWIQIDHQIKSIIGRLGPLEKPKKSTLRGQLQRLKEIYACRDKLSETQVDNTSSEKSKTKNIFAIQQAQEQFTNFLPRIQEIKYWISRWSHVSVTDKKKYIGADVEQAFIQDIETLKQKREEVFKTVVCECRNLCGVIKSLFLQCNNYQYSLDQNTSSYVQCCDDWRDLLDALDALSPERVEKIIKERRVNRNKYSKRPQQKYYSNRPTQYSREASAKIPKKKHYEKQNTLGPASRKRPSKAIARNIDIQVNPFAALDDM